MDDYDDEDDEDKEDEEDEEKGDGLQAADGGISGQEQEVARGGHQEASELQWEWRRMDALSYFWRA
jgi:hypothetical protein